MSGVDVNISVSNLPHLDRHQDDINHRPVINQQQNAHIMSSEVSQKIIMPVEVEQSEGKIISKKQKIVDKKERKGKKNKNSPGNTSTTSENRDNGYLIDVQA
ncbi:MAG TPA: hypothetical protein VHP36_02075 [Chitinispirillaceae bacterium]|nr:hypothetical protein [Chitinispirillaceae bacterium]